MDTTAVLAAQLQDSPDVLDALELAWSGAWSTVDPCLLELCRLQVATILQCHSELAARTPAAVAAGFNEAKSSALGSAWKSPLFSETERACLAFTDSFVMDVASLSDETAAAVSSQLGASGLVDFASALLIVEQRQRLALSWTALFGELP